MQSVFVLFAVLAVAAANSYNYAAVPQIGYGNAHRLGGNYAYTVQQPGYAGLNYGSPVVYGGAVPAASYHAPAYKTVSGVSPVVYSTGHGYSGLGYSGLNYGLTGYPTGYSGLSGLNGYTTVY